MLLKSQFFARYDADSPLLLLVHGRAGNIGVMQAFKGLVPAGVSILSVEAPLEDPEGGFRWWHFDKATDISIDIHARAIEAANKFADWLSNFLKEQQLKPRRLMALGFSQGAALLSCLIQLEKSKFYGVALLAGFVIPVPVVTSIPVGTNMPVESNIQSPGTSLARVFMAHGTKDQIIPISMAEEGANYLKNKGYQLSFISDEVGHKVGVSGMKALREWLDSSLKLELS